MRLRRLALNVIRLLCVKLARVALIGAGSQENALEKRNIINTKRTKKKLIRKANRFSKGVNIDVAGFGF